MKGNEAIAEAAVRGGCRFFAGYPITPQNEIPEYMSWRLFEVGGQFVQSESEVAAINMVYGAAAAGTRAMTSSSSPGISLKQEGISYIAGAELPCVIINMVRAAPDSAVFSLHKATISRRRKAADTAIIICSFTVPTACRNASIFCTTLLTKPTNIVFPS